MNAEYSNGSGVGRNCGSSIVNAADLGIVGNLQYSAFVGGSCPKSVRLRGGWIMLTRREASARTRESSSVRPVGCSSSY